MASQIDPNVERLQALDSAVLTPLVRQVLGSESLTVSTWNYASLSGGVGGGTLSTHLYHFRGQANDRDGDVEWSLVLKVLRAREGEALDSPQYWHREAELARSHLLDDLPGSFHAPRFFGVVDFPGEATWIWMEHVDDALGKSWPLSHYAIIGRHLGQFNGAYLSGRPLPSEPWLSTNWLRKQALNVAALDGQRLAALAHPMVKSAYSDDASVQLRRLRAETDLFCDHLDGLPQTLCHLDAFRRNLIPRYGADGQFETVAVDWAHTGTANVGADIAVVIVVGAMTMDLLAGDLPEADRIVFGAYLEGLSDMGWQGDPARVRLAYTASAAMKYLETGNIINLLADEALRPLAEQFTGFSVADMAKHYGDADRFVHQLADEARALM